MATRGENAIAGFLFGAAAVSSMAGPRDDTTLICAPPKTELAAGDESIMCFRLLSSARTMLQTWDSVLKERN